MTTRKQLIFSLFCLISFFSTKSIALSAVTVNTIKGNSPRFISSIENNIQSNKAFNYFGVIYNGNTYFYTGDLNTALGLDISTRTPESLGLSAAIKQPESFEVIDVDGDGDIKLLEDTDAPISLEWYYEDASNKEVKLTVDQTKTAFETLVKSGIYPYIKVSGGIALTTKYGAPNFQAYPDDKIAITKIPYRNFNIKVGGEAVKYASPHMLYSAPAYSWGDRSIFDWVDRNGFVPQDDYLNNFPSVGANDLFFYLITENIDNSLDTTKWIVRTSDPNKGSPGAITAIVTKSEASRAVIVGGFKAYDAKNMVLVTLKGPDSSSKGANQATAPKANLPVDIEIIGETKQGITLSYSFRITRWFINRGEYTDTHQEQNDWCNNLGDYKLASLRELSNANFLRHQDKYGNNPDNYYKRAVHGGLITEWGGLAYYQGDNFYNPTYGWTSDFSKSTGSPIYINMNDAAFNGDRGPKHQYYALCSSK